VATSTGVSGSCTITATVTFPGSAPLSATTTIIVVVLQRLLVWGLGANVLALPGDTIEEMGTPLGPTLTLLKCDARNYDQVGQNAGS
jgi:hypothetical protein